MPLFRHLSLCVSGAVLFPSVHLVILPQTSMKHHACRDCSPLEPLIHSSTVRPCKRLVSQQIQVSVGSKHFTSRCTPSPPGGPISTGLPRPLPPLAQHPAILQNCTRHRRRASEQPARSRGRTLAEMKHCKIDVPTRQVLSQRAVHLPPDFFEINFLNKIFKPLVWILLLVLSNVVRNFQNYKALWSSFNSQYFGFSKLERIFLLFLCFALLLKLKKCLFSAMYFQLL